MCIYPSHDPINLYRFGCTDTTDQRVLPLGQAGDGTCAGTEAALACYRQSIPNIVMGERVALAPLIDQTIRDVQETGQYTVLLVLTCTDTSDVQGDIAALERLAEYPISVIVVCLGVGSPDGNPHKYRHPLPTLERDIPKGLSRKARQHYETFVYDSVMGCPRIFEGDTELPTEQIQAAAMLQYLPKQYKKMQARGLIPQDE
ncbi:hypothetical protein KIPB_000735 [Kipferlia bialata]|uniref:Copine C-terminal domain-containing protein n=1 Tax=Kipferlia bialata TaxID=797122 RepID=A0A9K3CMS8_9EUKA|nr:hypothetical protein KIPB_000735 [Kipferlia bialata]|eukprot:g735.t1